MATVFLLYGATGSGKTSFARQLEQDRPAIRFTPDEWMGRLFGQDPPASSFTDRAAAIEDLLRPIWTRCLTLGLNVILDSGFWRRHERDRARAIARDLGAEPILCWVTCAAEEARQRVVLRNADPTRSLTITPATLALLNARIEPLGPDEPYRLVPTGAPCPSAD